jgi:hypothetical protein
MHGPLIVTILQVEKSKKSYELEKWQIERIFPVLQVEILYDKNSRLRIYIYTHTRFSHFSMPKKKQQIEIPAKMVKNITKLYMYIYTQSWRFHKGKIASLKTGHFACIYIYMYIRETSFLLTDRTGPNFFCILSDATKMTDIHVLYIFIQHFKNYLYTICYVSPFSWL